MRRRTDWVSRPNRDRFKLSNRGRRWLPSGGGVLAVKRVQAANLNPLKLRAFATMYGFAQMGGNES